MEVMAIVKESWIELNFFLKLEVFFFFPTAHGFS